MTSDGQPYARVRFKEIVSEQVLLGYLTKGGVPYSTSEEMSPYERKIALDTIRNLLETQAKAEEEKINNLRIAQKNKTPKTRMSR